MILQNIWKLLVMFRLIFLQIVSSICFYLQVLIKIVLAAVSIDASIRKYSPNSETAAYV